MRDMIAMLDGLGSYEVEPGNGANFVGGAAYPGQGFPVFPSSTGLASIDVEPGNGGLYVGGAAYPGQGFPVYPSSTGLADYASAFSGATTYTVEPGEGALYEGGASYPGQGFPLYASSEGLAAPMMEPGIQMQRARRVNTQVNNLLRLVSVVRTVARSTAANCEWASGPIGDAFFADNRMMRVPAFTDNDAELAHVRARVAVWKRAFAAVQECGRTQLLAGTRVGQQFRMASQLLASV